MTLVRIPVYIHVLPDGTNLNINVEAIRQMLHHFRTTPQPIPTVLVEVCLSQFWLMFEQKSFDPHRVMELRKRPRESLDPLIWGLFDDGEAMLMDGHHRYALAALNGWKTIEAWAIPETVWRDFLVQNGKKFTHQELRDLPIRKRDY